MRTPIAWFVRNPVATNLMMFLFLVGGYFSYQSLNQEEFPDIDLGSFRSAWRISVLPQRRLNRECA